jgi:hypothetical protein
MHRKLGLSVPMIILLAAIAATRVPLHDLGVVPEGSILAGLLVFVPLAIWLIVVLRRRVPNPLLTLRAHFKTAVLVVRGQIRAHPK